MSYAQLAELPVEFGLYSSFMGVLIYWFFATSKDITIGVSLNPSSLSLRPHAAQDGGPQNTKRNLTC